MRRLLGLDRFFEQRAQALGGVDQTDVLELRPGLVEVDAAATLAHGATSARAA